VTAQREKAPRKTQPTRVACCPPRSRSEAKVVTGCEYHCPWTRSEACRESAYERKWADDRGPFSLRARYALKTRIWGLSAYQCGVRPTCARRATCTSNVAKRPKI